MEVPINHHLHAGYGHPLTREWQSTETIYNKNTFIYPIFVLDEDGLKNPINSMPGQYQWSVNKLSELLDPLIKIGLRSLMIFGVITKTERKDLQGIF